MTVPASQAASARRSARRRTVEGDRTDRRQAILLAAERLFAERGYAAVSIRQIADAAGVPPALVDYHFGQKHELFIAIFHHWRDTIEQRLQRLREARAEADGDALRRVVEAFVMPVLALRCSAEGEFYAQLVARELVYRTPQAERVLAELFDPLAHAFIDALHAIAPQAGRAHAAWAYQFALGALLHHISDHRVERLSRGANRAADPAAAALLVDFIRAGIAAVLPPPRGNATAARAPVPLTPETTEETRMTRIPHRPLALAIACALLGAFGAAQAQQVIKLTAAAGHPPVFLWVKTLDETFIPEVDKKLAAVGNKYKIEWTKAWGGTLVKLGSESKGIADGVADLGIVSTIFEAAKFPLQNVSYYTPFGSDSIDLVGKTVGEMHKSVPAMADAWSKNNLVFLGGMSLDTYHIWTRFPLTRIEDLQGKKISAPGPSANWIRGTGAVGVAGTLNTYYEDIKSGVSDGAITFTTGAWGAKLHEVAPYVTRVNFGAQFAGGIAINKKRFDKLPPEVQKAIREAGDAWTAQYAKAQTAQAAALVQNMTSAGAKFSELSDVERKRWADALSPVGKVWAADVQSKGLPADAVLNTYMGTLVKAGTKVPRDWSK